MSPVVGAGLHCGDAAQQALVSDFDEPLGAAGGNAGAKHAARVAVPSVKHIGDVDIDDVAFAQRLVVGNAVADDVIDRGADRLAIAAVVERSGIGVVVAAEVEHELVERVGGDPGLDHRNQQVQRLRGEASGFAHAFEGFGAMQFDGAGAAGVQQIGIDEGHQLGPDGADAPAMRSWI